MAIATNDREHGEREFPRDRVAADEAAVALAKCRCPTAFALFAMMDSGRQAVRELKHR